MHIILSFDRYLAWYEVFLTNIDQSHPGAKELLNRGVIAVAPSLIPGALSAVDKIIFIHSWSVSTFYILE